jgi:hypothetical protein
MGETEAMAAEAAALAQNVQAGPLQAFVHLLKGLLNGQDAAKAALLNWENDLRSVWLIRLQGDFAEAAIEADSLEMLLQRRPMCRAAHLLHLSLASTWQAALDRANLALKRFPRDPYAIAAQLLLSCWAGTCSNLEASDRLAELEKSAPESWLAFSTGLGIQLATDNMAAHRLLEAYRRQHPRQLQATRLDLSSLDAFWRSWQKGLTIA